MREAGRCQEGRHDRSTGAATNTGRSTPVRTWAATNRIAAIRPARRTGSRISTGAAIRKNRSGAAIDSALPAVRRSPAARKPAGIASPARHAPTVLPALLGEFRGLFQSPLGPRRWRGGRGRRTARVSRRQRASTARSRPAGTSRARSRRRPCRLVERTMAWTRSATPDDPPPRPGDRAGAKDIGLEVAPPLHGTECFSS